MANDGYQVRPEELHAIADMLERTGEALDKAGSKPAPTTDAGAAMGDLNRLVSKLSRHAGDLVVACDGYAHALAATASSYHTRDRITGTTFERMGDDG